jgi:hypothetical protein
MACGFPHAALSRAGYPTRGCEDQAVERAVAQVNAPALARNDNSRTGRSISLATDLSATTSP